MDINYATGEISLKIVYYGPGLSGKTTNLEIIHQKAPETRRGKLAAISTEQDRTLFFDFMPLELGKIGGLKTKLRLFTVPGQVYYNSTRKLVLQRTDGVVFVADSQKTQLQENIDSLNNLQENLMENGLELASLPLVIQYNKRDLPNTLTTQELNQYLNTFKAPTFDAIAVKGNGVFPTLKSVSGLVLKAVEKKFSKTKKSSIKKFAKKRFSKDQQKPTQ